MGQPSREAVRQDWQSFLRIMGESQLDKESHLRNGFEEGEECEEGELDPRVQEELDRLNQTSVEINRLENEIDEARAQYRQHFQECSSKLGQLGTQQKKCVQRARPYYQLKEQAVQAQREALRAARQFQSANTVYRAAKETILLAEQRLVEESHTLSAAWQEMLNHATIRVMEAEKEKTRSEAEHHHKASVFSQLETKLQALEKKFKRSISKARPYFELKAEVELKLKQQKQNIEDLQAAVKAAKQKYAASLRQLEHISNAIHEARRRRILMLLPRQPGVGAESSDSSLASSSTLSDISGLELDSLTKPPLDSVDGDEDEDLDFDASCEEVFEPEGGAAGGGGGGKECHGDPVDSSERFVEGNRSPSLSTHSKYSADGSESQGEPCSEQVQTESRDEADPADTGAKEKEAAGSGAPSKEKKDLSIAEAGGEGTCLAQD